MNNPSSHLTWKELACKDGTEYPLKWRNNRLLDLVNAFETLRASCGNKPIQVLSAYRSERHNKKIGGARFSQHVNGRALDLRPPDGITVNEFFEIVRKLAKDLRIGGIGRYKTFIHIDTRPSDRLIIWNGQGVKDDTSNK